MTGLIGEHTAKVDSKGRINFPSAFIRQLPEGAADKMVLKADIYKKCLILYTMEEWNRQTDIIKARTNSFNPKHAAFIRGFFKGTAEVKVDTGNRILIPANLADYAEIRKDVYLLGQDSKIEIWAKEVYDKEQISPEDFAKLAEEIMGGDLPLL
ncbi:MAG: division/cell wall cluster transcriptional repressor MraZ [Chlorobi bacterium]|nr:division/cell wall cluster transcriptional repressor MraZ [Chlorobiota bacterium]